MTAESPHFKIRLPQNLKARLEQASRASGLSITAEIVQRLEDSFLPLEEKILATRLEELADLEDAVLMLHRELEMVVGLQGPAATVKQFKEKLKAMTALRDSVKKDVGILRALRDQAGKSS
ncbi:putative transcriptional regulator [Lysobacter enzymogenes]|uniref:Arc family DNA-binding protein n=1 Tax=Lysobacter enzymogenes TaxID=69 RepID=UPI0033965229